MIYSGVVRGMMTQASRRYDDAMPTLWPTLLVVDVLLLHHWAHQVELTTFLLTRTDPLPVRAGVYLMAVLAGALAVWQVLWFLRAVSPQSGAGFLVASLGVFVYAMAELGRWPRVHAHHDLLIRAWDMDVLEFAYVVGFASFTLGLASVAAACLCEWLWGHPE